MFGGVRGRYHNIHFRWTRHFPFSCRKTWILFGVCNNRTKQSIIMRGAELFWFSLMEPESIPVGRVPPVCWQSGGGAVQGSCCCPGGRVCYPWVGVCSLGCCQEGTGMLSRCVCVCVLSGGCSPGGVLLPCDLSHHAFDVTCLLPLHQLRMNTSEAAFIVLLGQVTCHRPMA